MRQLLWPSGVFMSYASINTRAQLGLAAPSVSVEVHLSNGLLCFSIVGLPELAVRESRERVRAALVNSHFKFPARRISVNLAPAANTARSILMDRRMMSPLHRIQKHLLQKHPLQRHQQATRVSI